MPLEPARLAIDGLWLWTSLAGAAVGLLAFGCAVRGGSLAPILVMLTVPLQRVVLVGEGGFHLTWTQVALAGFCSGALIRLLSGSMGISVDVVTIASLAIIAAYGLSVIVADRVSLWTGESYRWTVALFFLVLARPYAQYPNAAHNLLLGLTAMALTSFASGAIQALAGIGPSSFERFGLTRGHGGFGEPNPFGAFAVMVTLPCLAMLAAKADRPIGWPHWIAPCGAIAGTTAVATSQSRGAALGLGCGLVTILGVYSWVRTGERWWRLAVIGAASAAVPVIILLAVALQPQSDVEVTPGNWAERERRAHWGAASRMFLDNPATGVGAGGFNDNFRGSTTEWRFRIPQGHAHSAYLQVAAETGLAGLIAYIALLGGVIWRLHCRIRTLAGAWLSTGALAVTVAVAVHGLFDYLHVLSLGIVLSGIWAFGLAEVPRGVVPGEHNASY